MSETLTNGVIVPDKGSRDWYADLRSNWLKLDSLMAGGNITINPAQTEGILVATITVGGKEYKLYQQDGDVSVKIDPSAENAEYPLVASTSAEANTGSVVMAPVVTVNPSTGAVTATSFKGKLEGNASTATNATKAVQDGAGAVIADTYATKKELGSKANDSDVVHKSGDETIAGIKKFTNTPVMNRATVGTKEIAGAIYGNSTNDKQFYISAGTGWHTGGQLRLLGLDSTDKPGSFELKAYTTSNVSSLVGRPDGYLTWNNANIITDANLIMVLKNLTGALIAPGAVIDCSTGNGLLAGWFIDATGAWKLANNKITGKWKNVSIYDVENTHSVMFVKVG